MTPNDRREAIIQYLYEERYTTCNKLAEIFGVSERTIWRDIEQLTCRYGIECIPGKFGGIYLSQCQTVNKYTLTAEQINWLTGFLDRPNVTEEDRQISLSILEKFSPWRAEKIKSELENGGSNP